MPPGEVIFFYYPDPLFHSAPFYLWPYGQLKYDSWSRVFARLYIHGDEIKPPLSAPRPAGLDPAARR